MVKYFLSTPLKSVENTKYKKNTKNISLLILKAINGGTIILSKCAVCNTKKSIFIKKEETKRLLSKLDIKAL